MVKIAFFGAFSPRKMNFDREEQ